MEEKKLLEIRNLSRSFPGVKALDDVSLTLESGSVHALVGENGAGKSTLMKCLMGICRQDGGEILLWGSPVQFAGARQAMESGVAMVHQELSQAFRRSAAENLWMGRYPARFGVVDRKRMYRETKAVFDSLGIDVDPDETVGNLSVSQRQMIEIAKAVSRGAKVVIFDEPTSSLGEEESRRLFRLIGTLRRQGCGILYSSHRMDEILRISDEVTILRNGKKLLSAPAETLTTERILSLMAGRDPAGRFPEKDSRPGEEILSVEGLTGSGPRRVRDVSFTLRKGEILGVAGLTGSGRTALLETLFGIRGRKEGKIFFRGRECRNGTPRDAIRGGFALITEERRETGIFGVLDIRENATAVSWRRYRRRGVLSEKRRGAACRWVIDTMNVKTPSQKTPIRNLSGGNQQKVVLGRWLLARPSVLLMDEPTRGVDAGARFEIYQQMRELTRRGKSIIMVSSELPELLGLCDRILVMSGGRLAGITEGKGAAPETIAALWAVSVQMLGNAEKCAGKKEPSKADGKGRSTV